MVYELGIISNGVPLVSKQYYHEYKVTIDSALRAGFLSALNAFAGEAFAEDLESFSMKNFKIVLLCRLIRESPRSHVTSYCVGDKKLKIKTAQKALTRILDEFIEHFSHLPNFTGDLSIFEEFTEVFDKTIGDLAKKPEDRLRTLFK